MPNGTVEDLGRILKDDCPVIWVGAGASVAAGYPDTADLIEQLVKLDPAIPIIGDDGKKLPFFQIVSEAIRMNGPIVFELLNRAIQIPAKPVEFHHTLARLCKAQKVRWILTTNYDTLIEDTLRSHGVRFFPQILERNFDVYGQEDVPRVVKLHGSADDWLRVVLSAESFEEHAKRYPRLNQQVTDLLQTCRVVFFGCSMQDPTIAAFLSGRTPEQKRMLRPWRSILARRALEDLNVCTYKGERFIDLFNETFTRWIVTGSHEESHEVWKQAVDRAAYRYELFILYRYGGHQQGWVEQHLVPALRNAGIDPVLARDAFDAGGKVAEETRRVIDCSKQVLWVLSSDSVTGNDVLLGDDLLWKFSAETPFAGIPLVLGKVTLPTAIRDAVPLSWAEPAAREPTWRRMLEQLGAPRKDVPPPGGNPVSASRKDASSLRRCSTYGSNYVLMSPESGFTKQLGDLLIQDERVGAGHCYSESPKNFEDYWAGLWEFLNDPDPSAEWLFTVQPEDGWAPRLSSSKEREILDKLASTGKKIAFFESGNRFLEYGAAPRRNNIFLIRTKYGAAVRNMITWAVEQHFGPVARLRDRACMHIVMVHGPANPAANERRRVYTEFAACLQADQGLSGSEPPSRVEWEELCSPLSNCELYVTSTIQKSWFRDEAKAAVLRHAKRIALASDGERACFFCGNDDMALGAVDAMRELKEEQAVANGQIAFCGFDGLEEFTQRIRRPGEFDGFRGATARVNMSRMRDVAVELVKTMGKSHATGDISIDAESIIASPVS